MAAHKKNQEGLNNFYQRALARKEPLSSQHAKIFLDALALQPDPVSTLERLYYHDQGPAILRSALSSNSSAKFLNEQAAGFIDYLKHPDVKTIHGGTFLQNLLWTIVETSFFWDALVAEVRAETLTDRSVSAFAWLLLELISLPDVKALRFLPTARDSEIFDLLVESVQS